MSAEGFEVIPNNDDEKDLDDRDSEHEQQNMIASDVQFVNSQSVSLNSSSQSESVEDDSVQSQSMPPSPPHSEDEQSVHDTDDSDMEESPLSNNNNNNKIECNSSDNEQQHENKDQEEGRPVVESCIESMTPSKDKKKLSDNPYLNGSKSTPNGMAEQHEDGEDSDYEQEDNSDDDDVDLIPPHFTHGHEESDEEKDGIEKMIAKKARSAPQNAVGKDASNSSMILMSITIAVIASVVAYLHYHSQSVTDQNLEKPEPPKFHCPDSIVYVPMDGNSFFIDASR